MGDSLTDGQSNQPLNLSIELIIKRLRQLTQLDVQTSWRTSFSDGPVSQQCNPTQWQSWQSIPLNERGHIAWVAGKQVLWLGQIIQFPHAWADYPLQGLTARLALTWWAESADIYVNGQLVQQGDLFDCSARVVLLDKITPGATVNVAVRLVSPGHDAGAMVRSCLICEPAAAAADRIDPGMVADELAVLQTYVLAFRPEDTERLTAAVRQIPWQDCSDAPVFEQALKHLRLNLAGWGRWLKERRIGWVGHAHLDLAWLWPVADTWDAAERTFQSVLNLQKDFDELIFCHSSPALYAWVEHHRPELFAQIQQQSQAGRWEVAAGLWVEPELNLVSGESLVRQVLYGQRYTQSRFGEISKVAWLPDSFGFCWQLPQILKQGGVEYFLTQKLRWNDTTQFPHEVFWWQAPDGSSILSIMTPPIGESMDPVKMTGYAQGWESKTQFPESLWLPGVGDHGGGPTRDMLEVGRRWQQSSLFPQLEPTTTLAFCQQVESKVQDIATWNNELYLEFHRGCYTSHADQKRYNRRAEHLLTEAEMFSAIATILTPHPYPKLELEQAWKQVLFNQFHDILPGSSIPEVFADANQDWEAATQTALDLRAQAFSAIAAAIDLPDSPIMGAIPIIVFNSLNWERAEVITWHPPQEMSIHGQVFDGTGRPMPTQVDRQIHGIRFWATIPSIGYQVFWYAAVSPQFYGEAPQDWILENDLLRVEICPQTGNILSMRDRTHSREALSGAGNVLQFFQDQGQYWDAWNIDPNFAQHPLEEAELKTIEWVSWGAIHHRIRVVRQWRNSRFSQDYVLDAQSLFLKIETQVDWQETHVLVKAAFPFTVTAEYATYEIPCGAIERPTLPNPQPLPDWQQAKWEVPALHWADLSQSGEEAYGVSLLKDCKYGYDAQPNGLRLTLLRGPVWPDPECDRGVHEFTYAIYPHSGSWQDAETVRLGYALNRPLICQPLQRSNKKTSDFCLSGSFLSISARNLILMAFKQSEDDENQWILRCHECSGQSANPELQVFLPLKYQGLVDGLEDSTTDTNGEMGAWQVRSQCWSTQPI